MTKVITKNSTPQLYKKNSACKKTDKIKCPISNPNTNKKEGINTGTIINPLQDSAINRIKENNQSRACIVKRDLILKRRSKKICRLNRNP